MIYSVWKPGGGYDYYRCNAQVEYDPRPKHLARRGSELGTTPDAAAWPLPADAQKFGSGAYAQGRVATPATRGMRGLGDAVPAAPSNLGPILIIGGIGAWLALRGK